VGAAAGWWASRRGRWGWIGVYGAARGVIGWAAVEKWFPAEVIAWGLPISLGSGIHAFAWRAAAVAAVLAAPGFRLPSVRERQAVLVGGLVLVALLGARPALSAAHSARELAGLNDRWFADGVCRQSTDYTCGPAAAATALRLLGVPAKEGELGILAGTSPAWGTPPDELARVLREQFAPVGLQVGLHTVSSLSELRSMGLVLVTVRFGWFVDHWVCVREVTDEHVVVGDPLVGWERRTHAEFLEGWRHNALKLSR
jgi:hypothetical protein